MVLRGNNAGRRTLLVSYRAVLVVESAREPVGFLVELVDFSCNELILRKNQLIPRKNQLISGENQLVLREKQLVPRENQLVLRKNKPILFPIQPQTNGV